MDEVIIVSYCIPTVPYYLSINMMEFMSNCRESQVQFLFICCSSVGKIKLPELNKPQIRNLDK